MKKPLRFNIALQRVKEDYRYSMDFQINNPHVSMSHDITDIWSHEEKAASLMARQQSLCIMKFMADNKITFSHAATDGTQFYNVPGEIKQKYTNLETTNILADYHVYDAFMEHNNQQYYSGSANANRDEEVAKPKS